MVRMQIPPMDAWTSNVAQGSVVRITKSIVIEKKQYLRRKVNNSPGEYAGKILWFGLKEKSMHTALHQQKDVVIIMSELWKDVCGISSFPSEYKN